MASNTIVRFGRRIDEPFHMPGKRRAPRWPGKRGIFIMSPFSRRRCASPCFDSRSTLVDTAQVSITD